LQKRFTLPGSPTGLLLARVPDSAFVLQKAFHISLGHLFDSCFPALRTR
jgi:hypothetical protein